MPLLPQALGFTFWVDQGPKGVPRTGSVRAPIVLGRVDEPGS